MRPCEGFFKFFQLEAREGGPVTSLLPLRSKFIHLPIAIVIRGIAVGAAGGTGPLPGRVHSMMRIRRCMDAVVRGRTMRPVVIVRRVHGAMVVRRGVNGAMIVKRGIDGAVVVKRRIDGAVVVKWRIHGAMVMRRMNRAISFAIMRRVYVPSHFMRGMKHAVVAMVALRRRVQGSVDIRRRVGSGWRPGGGLFRLGLLGYAHGEGGGYRGEERVESRLILHQEL